MVVENAVLAVLSVKIGYLVVSLGQEAEKLGAELSVKLSRFRLYLFKLLLGNLRRLVAGVSLLYLLAPSGVALFLFALGKLGGGNVHLYLTVIEYHYADSVAGLSGSRLRAFVHSHECLFKLLLAGYHVGQAESAKLGYSLALEKSAVKRVAAEIVDVSARLKLGVVKAYQHLLREHDSQRSAHLGAVFLKALFGGKLGGCFFLSRSALLRFGIFNGCLRGGGISLFLFLAK